MSLPPVPKNWHWAKGTPAGGLHAWLESLRAKVTTLESDSGTSVTVISNNNGTSTLTATNDALTITPNGNGTTTIGGPL